MSQPGIYPPPTQATTTTNSSNGNSSSMLPIAAENYQLKWNSHVTNLNSSISSLYKNDKYADCMLFTCNVDEGCFNFAAHKLILATCSHYFSALFESNPMPINGMIFIVLPPELSRRSMGILLQYMYMGEATVGNDILNEVLKGGEVLKIRGLCKVQSDTPTFSTASASTSCNPQQPTQARASPMRSNKSTPRSSIDRKSSVDMKSHHIPPPSYVLTQHRSESPPPSQPPTTIIVKKTADVTIDHSDNGNIPVEHYGLMSLKIAAAVKKAQQQNSHNSISSMKKSTSTNNVDQHHHNRGGDFYSTIIGDPPQSQQHFEATNSPPPPPYKIYTSANDNSSLEQQIQEDILRYTEKKRRIAENSSNPTTSSTVNGQSHHQQQNFHDDRRYPEALSFVSIKEEPLEWPEMAHIDQSKGELVDINVKPECLDEPPHHHHQQHQTSSSSSSFSPLTCETCNLKFQVPSAWVRHIESHSEAANNSSSSSSCSGGSAQHNVPKKRKRTSEEHEENVENINILSCDLCENIQFSNPAEWVRHVQNTHTENELAISNSILMKNRPSNNNSNGKSSSAAATTKEQHPNGERACSVCKKMYPSYASMLIHKRTHNAEKSFVCPQCNKGFNVKSNLLRHMRSCHNENPSIDNQHSNESGDDGME